MVRGLREMATKHHLTGNKKATVSKVCAYLENNRERMHYDAYLARGYPIASGAIEGACRHLVKDRMEVDTSVRQVVSYLEKQLQR